MSTMTVKEFRALPSERRHVGMDGRAYVLGYDQALGTVLEPVAVTCDRCKREMRPWPLRRADVCSPKDWAYCIRQAS